MRRGRPLRLWKTALHVGGLTYPRTFFFPTIGEYAPLLEEQGFRVDFALLFDRPTVQQSPQGLENWIRTFVKEPFSQIPASLKDEIIYETVDSLETILPKWPLVCGLRTPAHQSHPAVMPLLRNKISN